MLLACFWGEDDVFLVYAVVSYLDLLPYFIPLGSGLQKTHGNLTAEIVDVDYLVSPVKDDNGNFYDSRICAKNETTLPENADANGAYNIARKALWAVSVLKNTEDNDLRNCNLSIKNADWLEFVQK